MKSVSNKMVRQALLVPNGSQVKPVQSKIREPRNTRKNMCLSDFLSLDEEFRIFYFLLSISSLKVEKKSHLKNKTKQLSHILRVWGLAQRHCTCLAWMKPQVQSSTLQENKKNEKNHHHTHAHTPQSTWIQYFAKGHTQDDVLYFCYLSSFNLLLDDGWVNARAFQVMDNILGVFDSRQESCHIIPELFC